MIRTIIKKEILHNLLSYKFTITTVLSTVLVLVSLLVMYRDYALRLENYEILQPESDEAIAIIPPTPLSMFARGLDENLCRSFGVWLSGQIEVGSKQQSVNNLFRLFTTPDLVYLVKVIMALCAILFAFDTVSGEKELGTLRQSLSNSVKRPTLIIGKWIGGFTAFIIPFLSALLLGAILVSLSPLVQMNGQNWAKLGMFVASSVIYLAVFFSLGMLISSLTHRSPSSLVICLLLWAVLVFVIPNLGNTVARQLVEIPSVQQLEVKREQFSTREFFKAANRRKSWGESFKSVNFENEKLIADYRARFNRLVNVSQNITRFSPAAAFTYLATDLMGTGILEERRLKKAVLEYKDLVWKDLPPPGGEPKGDITPFVYQRWSVTELLGFETLCNLLVLILFNVLFFVSAYVSFLRYDVR